MSFLIGARRALLTAVVSGLLPPSGLTWALVKDLSNESPAQTHVYSLAYDAASGVALAGTYGDGQIWRSIYD